MVVSPYSLVALTLPKTSRTPRKPTYDLLGFNWQEYHCQATTATSSSPPPKHLSSDELHELCELREFQNETKRQQILILANLALRPHLPSCLVLWFRA